MHPTIHRAAESTRRARLIVGVGVVAVALVIGAIYVTRGGEDSSAPSQHEPLAPALKSAAGSLARIEVTKGGTAVSLVKQGDDWVVESSSGYPAKLDAVRELVAGIAGLELDEALTAKKDRHAELGLAWPDPAGKAALVRLVPAQGEPIEVVLGEQKYSPSSQYARRLKEDQTWRCRSAVTIETEPGRWMSTELLALPPDETVSVTYQGLELNRTQEEGKPAQWIASLCAGPVDESAWNDAKQTQAKSTLPSWLSRIEFEDVRRRGDTWNADPNFTATFDTLHATVRMEGMTEGNATWVRFGAEPKPDAPPVPDDKSVAKHGAGTPFIPDWKAWNDDVARWEFKLPEWKRSAIMRIQEPPKPPTPAVVPGGSPLPPGMSLPTGG
ncbi:MAG: DUF4340 domain-containing protein [Phycisphaerales bacterium]